MSSYGSGKSGFNKALEKGTSSQLTEPDWDAIIAICDIIRGGDLKPKYAIDGIMKKILQDNQASAQNALQILESVVKNCGPKIHSEVANPSFMEFMKNQSKLKSDSVKAKILELIQCWAHAFRDNAEYKAVADTFEEMKNSGVTFPVLREADAMFTSEVQPEWKEDDNCFSCRTDFGTFTRRHHCRACGQSFCSKCSSKSSIIPKFGIEKEVRVCDGCYNKLNNPSGGSKTPGDTGKADDSDLPAEYLNSPLYKQSMTPSQTPAPGGKSKEEVEEEEQLQLALAISQSEAEAKEQEKKRRQTYMSLDATPPGGMSGGSSAPIVQPTGPKIELDQDLMTPELQKYLNRNYWEQKQKESSQQQPPQQQTQQQTQQPPQQQTQQQTQQQQPPQQQPAVKATQSSTIAAVTTPSAPPSVQSEPVYSSVNKYTENEGYENGNVNTAVTEESEADKEQFMKAMSGSIDVFINRMNSNSARGRSIITDSAVQTLFATLQNMHPQLLSYIQAQEDQRSQYEGLQDKLAQLRDARDALTALRQEHEEKRRIEAEERAKRKQIQMMQKLDILRKQKQQVLDKQRLEAMQRLQQQQAEMAARMEVQKQQTQMRQMQLHGFPQELQTNYGQYNPMMPPQAAEYHQMGQYGAAPQQAGMTQLPMGNQPQYQQPNVESQQQAQQFTMPPQQMQSYSGYDGQVQPPQQMQQPPQQPPQQIQQPPQQLPQQQMQQQFQQTGMAPNQIPQGYQGQPGSYQPPPNQQLYSGGFQQQPGGVYSTFNMQGMSENLPPPSGQAPPTYQSTMQQPQQPQYPQMAAQSPADMQQAYASQMGGPPVGQYPQQQAPQVYQQAPPPQDDSQLISFD